ncbi:MAG: V-type ATP synthase subunit D [Clostridiales bacterium]|nr:V-type ATP synthase subunit D [Clostridiales bacterium]
MNQLVPTKANLIKSKSMLEFSIKGFELLDKKRNVLIREMMNLVSRAEKIQKDIDSMFSETYNVLINANITLGSSAVEEIAISIPKDEDIVVLSKSIMGVEIPVLKYSNKPKEVSYGFFRTNAALDMAVAKMSELQLMIYELAEVENSVFRLAMEVKKTGKRANALDKIQIPKYRELTKYIEEVLEEKEREDFFRLKKVKNKTKR